MLLMHCHLNEGQSAERRLEKAGKGQGGALWGARCLPQLPLGAPSRARSVPLYDGVVISLIASRRASSRIGAATSVQISPFYGHRNVDACRAGELVMRRAQAKIYDAVVKWKRALSAWQCNKVHLKVQVASRACTWSRQAAT